MTAIYVLGGLGLIVLIFIACFLYYLWGAVTLLFVSAQFNEADRKGAREELRRFYLAKAKEPSIDIVDYLNNDPSKTQIILQYIYAFNRIGVGVRYKALRSGIIFKCWLPSWFWDTWDILWPLIVCERKRRKLLEFANSAEWLVDYSRRK